MCGICGFNWKDKKLIKSMNDVIQHRGPDQDGVYCCKDISFGHRRLSIIDLSEHGRQPMFNEDKTICMVFNGEIYNYEELKPQLIALGHKFISDSDSEVIIHAYEEYGIDVLDKLRGMFAFSIWDSKKELMFLARDRIGIKPLYYYHKGDKFLFGSEIKSILEDATVPRVVNLQAMYDYIGFEFVPAPQTMFKDIYKVPAGHYLILKGDQLEMKQYWDMSLVPAQEELSFEESVEREKEELEYAVKSHLMSDVPLGVFLSGGLDSSALVAMMRKHITGPLKTFTIGYNDKTFSEVEYAKQVADYFDTEHHVLILDKLKPDYVEKALWHLDEPMTDLSAVPLFLLCEQVKQHATVC
ncbi:MAG: asparagine synthase (glutamine-hydrolyzing), partial [Kiritimatiellae bacterium]|nr:asparagine synthase (glutamine-hydrolyzing) [Kiritimatiellia bacterium]